MQLTEEQRRLLISDITAKVVQELTGKDLRVAQDRSRPFNELLKRYRKQLYDKFGTYVYWQVWECIRKLATYRAGHRYVRDLLLSEEEEAAKFAEEILLLMGLEKVD